MRRVANAAVVVMLLLGVVCTLGAADQYAADDGYGEPTTPANQINECTVKLIGEAYVPAMVPGVIESIAVSEGAVVTKDAPLAQLDARESKMDVQLAQDELKVAEKQATNDIDRQVAEAASGKASAEYQSALEANKTTAGAFTRTELYGLWFEYIRAKLAIKQAEHEFEIAKVTVKARKTQVKAAELAVTRREIKAPIDGIVEEVLMHEGEWANPGDALFKIEQLGQLKVQGYVNSRELHRSEVAGKTVSVDVVLARGRRVQFTGRIDFVSTEIDGNDDYLVWATVENRKENGHWVLSPGMAATMTIDVGTLQAAERATPNCTR